MEPNANEADRTERARDVVRLIVKAVKLRRLYGAKHLNARGAFAELGTAVNLHLARFGALRLEVVKDSFLLDTTRLLEEESREANLATAFHAGGVRDVTILPDVADQELAAFLDLLGRPVGEGDLAEAIWEADLELIVITCVRELSDELDPAPSAVKARSNISEKTRNLLGELRARGIIGKAPPLFREEDDEEEVDLFADASDDEEDAPALIDDDDADDDDPDEIVPISRTALKQLREEIEAAGTDRMLSRLIDAVIKGLDLAPEVIGCENATWFLQQAPGILLRSRDLGALAGMLEGFSSTLMVAQGSLATSLRSVMDRMAQTDQIKLLVPLAKDEARGGPQALCRVLDTLGRPGVKAAVKTLAAGEGGALDPLLRQLVARKAAQNADLLAPLVSPAMPVELTRWALGLASRQPNGKALESLCATAKSHKDAGVRDYADFLFRTQTPRGRFSAFVAALDAEAVPERVRAAEQLAKTGDRQALDPLKTAVEAASFLQRTEEEQRAFLSAVREIGGRAEVPFLLRQSERKTWVHWSAAERVRKLATTELEKLKERRAS